MLGDKMVGKRICTICARGGSKGVKNKNIRDMLGKPLIAYSLIQARESRLFDAIGVSSDSDMILSVAKEWGVEYLIKRPNELALDQSAKVPVIRHAVLTIEGITGQKFDTTVDLDATSPLRNVSDITECIRLLENYGHCNVITATPSHRSPYFNMVELEGNNIPQLSKKLMTPVVRRQDAPRCFDMNASIYVWNRETLMQQDSLFHDTTGLYIMPAERSLDIDQELDFEIVTYLMKRKLKNNES